MESASAGPPCDFLLFAVFMWQKEGITSHLPSSTQFEGLCWYLPPSRDTGCPRPPRLLGKLNFSGAQRHDVLTELPCPMATWAPSSLPHTPALPTPVPVLCPAPSEGNACLRHTPCPPGPVRSGGLCLPRPLQELRNPGRAAQEASVRSHVGSPAAQPRRHGGCLGGGEREEGLALRRW